MSSTAPAILKLPEVLRRTGHSRSVVYALVAEGQFPSPVKIGIRSVGWVESEVSDYITARITAHRSRLAA